MRPARLGDAAAIARVQAATWRTAYRGILPDAYLDTMAADAARVERWRGVLAAVGPQVAFVAEARRHVIGFASGGPCRGEDPRFDVELSALYLRPVWQGRGLGGRLFKAVTGALAAGGGVRMKVWVLEEGPSRAIYEHLGGRLCDRRTEAREGGRLLLSEVAYGYDLRPHA